MSHKLVSIVMPFKNTAAFIAECLSSIQDQQYNNWEAICVDDDSTDNSYTTVQRFAAQDSRFKVFKNKGSGIIDALQTAYENAKGDFITRMDSDDIMTPNRLDVMVKSLLKYGKKHVAIGQVNYFRADGLSDGFARYETWLNGLTVTGSNFSEIYKECVIPSPCWMVYTTDFEACNGFNVNRYPEDYDLAFRFYEANYTCIPCKAVLLHWRDYSLRTSRTHKHYAENSFLDLKVHYFLKLNYNSNQPLTVWGAGAKGKTLAKLLIKNHIPFTWICDNPKKIGKHIYEQQLYNFNHLQTLVRPQCIVTVANAEAQREITTYFKSHVMENMKDYFFFC